MKYQFCITKLKKLAFISLNYMHIQLKKTKRSQSKALTLKLPQIGFFCYLIARTYKLVRQNPT